MFKYYSFSESRAVLDIFPGRFVHSSSPLKKAKLAEFSRLWWMVFGVATARKVGHDDESGLDFRQSSAFSLE